MAKQTRKVGSDALRRVILQALVAAVVLGGGAWGFHRLRVHVEKDIVTLPSVPRVVMVDRPVWMNDRWAENIINTVQPRHACSPLDQSILRDIALRLSKNPWVKEVRAVRRVYGQAPGDTIEINCTYRAPIAIVSHTDRRARTHEYIMVDAEGYRLPETYLGNTPPQTMFGPEGRVELRIIEGIAQDPPAQAGRQWLGDDLKAALQLAELLYGRSCAEEIHRIDASNYAGRRGRTDAQLSLITKYNSQIRWGEPVNQKFHAELPPADKLRNLALIREQFGRVDAKHSWLDIRFETVTFPKEESPLLSSGEQVSNQR